MNGERVSAKNSTFVQDNFDKPEATLLNSTIIETNSAPTTSPVANVLPDTSHPPRLNKEALEQHYRNVEDELQLLRDSELRLKQQHIDSQRRERILIRRLALKEQELQDYMNQITEFKTSQVPGPASLRSALLDPAVNILLHKLKVELQTTRARLEDTQNELSAWKFTPDSNTGKRLMAKCRLLYQENEELGKMTSNGRMAKLEGDLALQKSFSEEVKKSQSELDDFLQELDEDVEGMQSTILFLQQELKTSKETIGQLESEIHVLKKDENSDDDRSGAKEQYPIGFDATARQHLNAQFQASNELLQINAYERTLNSDRVSSASNVVQAPRTLRSSSRYISNDDASVGKVNIRKLRNGNSELQDTRGIVDELLTQKDGFDEKCNPGECINNVKSDSTDKTKTKRSFDAGSESSEESGVSVVGADVVNNISSKHNIVKKVRRSSIFKMDEDEKNTECGNERTLQENISGNIGSSDV